MCVRACVRVHFPEATLSHMAAAALAFVCAIFAVAAWACAAVTRRALQSRLTATVSAVVAAADAPCASGNTPQPPPQRRQQQWRRRPTLRVNVIETPIVGVVRTTALAAAVTLPPPQPLPVTRSWNAAATVTASKAADTRRPFRVLCRGCGRVFGDANMRKHFFCEFSEDERVAILSLARELAARGQFVSVHVQ